MDDAIIRRIKKETAACVLPAIKAWAIEKRFWDEETHGPVYAKRNQQLQERWK